MDRLEVIRELVDQEITKLNRAEERKFAYIHTYGVAQAAAFLATVRNLDIELSCIAAMLHDIGSYVENCPHKDHAQRGAKIAEKMLLDTGLFTEEEIGIITHAIAVHSSKTSRHDGPISEMLKDADVLQHYLYNVKIPLPDRDNFRLFYLLEDIKKITKKDKDPEE